MKKLIYSFVIALVAFPLFSVNVKVGASYVGKFGMQVSPYGDTPYYNGRLLPLYKNGEKINGRIYRAQVDENNTSLYVEELGNTSVEPYFSVSDRNNLGIVEYGYSLRLSSSLTTNHLTNMRGSFDIGVSNGNLGLFLSAEKDYYSLFNNKITQDIEEVGATVRFNGKLSWFLSVEADLGAYVYPRFELRNLSVSNIREKSFSTKAYAKVSLDTSFLKAYVGGGLASWQLPPTGEDGIIGEFSVLQIRNAFDFGASLNLGGVGVFIEYNYFCDHPEVSWDNILKGEGCTNSHYGLATCGFTFEI